MTGKQFFDWQTGGGTNDVGNHVDRAKPAAGEQNVVIGLPIFRDIAELAIVRLLTQPFRNDGSPLV